MNTNWQSKYDAELSALILQARIKAELTQEQLAERIGTTQSSIARAENGSVLPSHVLLKKIADAVNMKLEPPKLV